jgi:enamine deaminase RidA (YjgF/YER057c/UK114 family)
MTAPPDAAARPHQTLLPEGWPKPKGYANGVLAEGRTVFVGGQIGWDTEGRFEPGFLAQTRKALENIVAVIAEAGAGPQDLVRLTWFVVDLDAYLADLRGLGQVYREVIGPNYPAMSVVQVVRLVEREALVEIEATAVIPDGVR